MRGIKLIGSCVHLLILSLIIPENICAEKTITIASGEWPPYQSEHLEYYGFTSRIVTEAFALEGISVTYGFMPWKRSYEESKKGKWDATFLWASTDERMQFFDFSEPIITGRDVFFYLKSEPFHWDTYQDLKGVLIGGVIGYDYGPDFQHAEKTGIIVVDRTKNDEINVRKLLAGRIQVFVCNVHVGSVFLNKLFDKKTVRQFTFHPKPVRRKPYYLLFSKAIPDNKKKMKFFNSGLKIMKNNGRYDQIILESGVSD